MTNDKNKSQEKKKRMNAIDALKLFTKQEQLIKKAEATVKKYFDSYVAGYSELFDSWEIIQISPCKPETYFMGNNVDALFVVELKGRKTLNRRHAGWIAGSKIIEGCLNLNVWVDVEDKFYK